MFDGHLGEVYLRVLSVRRTGYTTNDFTNRTWAKKRDRHSYDNVSQASDFCDLVRSIFRLYRQSVIPCIL